jgi:hypothetical protein
MLSFVWQFDAKQDGRKNTNLPVYLKTNHMKTSNIYILAICVFSLNSLALFAQRTPVFREQPDFSGTWILDHARSDAEFRDYKMTCIITQKDTLLTVEQILVMKSGEKSSFPAITYNLNGKEEIREEQGGKSKLVAKWASPDHKTLTIKYMRNLDGNEAGSVTIYKLSENEEFLTIRSSDLKGDSPMVQVYKKK